MDLLPQQTAKPDEPRSTILIIDDNPINLSVISEHLKTHGFKILMARDGKNGLQRAEYALPDLILLDVMMPGIDGFETCRRLKENEKTKDIPVIFLTALTRAKNKIKGFEVGAVDYITKPLQYEEVIIRITTHLQVQQQARELQALTAELKTAHQTLSWQTLQLDIINELSQHMVHISDLRLLLHEIATTIQSKFGYYFVGLWLLDETENQLRLEAGVKEDGTALAGTVVAIEPDTPTNLLSTVCQTGEMRLVESPQDHALHQDLLDMPTIQTKLSLPLSVDTRTIGVLDIQCDQVTLFTAEEKKALQFLAHQLGRAIHYRQQHEATHQSI